MNLWPTGIAWTSDHHNGTRNAIPLAVKLRQGRIHPITHSYDSSNSLTTWQTPGTLRTKKRKKFRYTGLTMPESEPEPKLLQTFIANRVSHIQERTNVVDWRHVPTGQNPADLLSIGLLPGKFLKNNIWNDGSNWLVLPQSRWSRTKQERRTTYTTYTSR